MISNLTWASNLDTGGSSQNATRWSDGALWFIRKWSILAVHVWTVLETHRKLWPNFATLIVHDIDSTSSHLHPLTVIDQCQTYVNARDLAVTKQCCWGSLLATKHFTKSCNEARTLVMATSHVVGYRATEHPRLFEESARGRVKACDFYDYKYYNNLPLFYVVHPLITVPWRGSVSLSSDFPYPFDIGIFTSSFRISSSSFWVPQISIYFPVNGHRQGQGLEDEFPLRSLKTCDFQGPTLTLW